MTRREFFGVSAISAAGIYANAAQIPAENSAQMSEADKWKQDIKIITQTPIKAAKPADIIIYGDIYTAYDKGVLAQALAIKDGKFVYVGAKDGVGEFKGANTKVYDFKDSVINPGFIDGHVHAHMGMSEKILKVNLEDCDTIDELKLTLKRYINENPELKVIQGIGWSEAIFDGNDPSADILDDLGDKPIILTALSHHTEFLNKAAMKAAGIDKNTPDVDGGVITRDKDGNPLGIFKENAALLSPHSPIHKIIPKISEEQRIKIILAVQEYFFSKGLTAFMDAGMNIDYTDNWLKTYKKLDDEGLIQIHAFGSYIIRDTPEALNELQKIAKQYANKGKNFKLTNIKVLLDGVLEGQTAYLKDPYNNKPGYKGEFLWDKERLAILVAKANELGFSVHAHAIGDAAISAALDAFTKAGQISGIKDARNAITHLQLVDEVDFARFAKLGVVAVTNPYWHITDAETTEIAKKFIGEKRANNQYPLKSFLKAGVKISFASDFSVSQPNPLEAIQIAATRKLDSDDEALNPKEVISVNEAFLAATMGGAYQLKAEKQIGSIEVGKSADLVVLDADMNYMEKNKLLDIKPKITICAGKVVYEKKSRYKKQGAFVY